jgi:hypothetical protein
MTRASLRGGPDVEERRTPSKEGAHRRVSAQPNPDGLCAGIIGYGSASAAQTPRQTTPSLAWIHRASSCFLCHKWLPWSWLVIGG